MEKKKLKIKIFEKEYSLLVENEEIAKELAIYVNKVMEETKDELPDQPAQTIAIIACLNIAYDLFIEKNKNREFQIRSLLENNYLSLPRTHISLRATMSMSNKYN